MSDFAMGALFGAGVTAFLGIVCRQILHAAAERRFREVYIATLTPSVREKLLGYEASGTLTWRQFRERES